MEVISSGEEKNTAKYSIGNPPSITPSSSSATSTPPLMNLAFFKHGEKNKTDSPLTTTTTEDYFSSIYDKNQLRKFTTFQKIFGVIDVNDYKENLKQWKQFLFSIIVAILGAYIGSMFGIINESHEINGYAHIRKLDPNFRLVDGLYLVSNLNMPWLPGAFLAHILTIVLLRVIVFCGPYSMRATMLRRTFVFMGILYVSRGLCLLSTTLPRADTNYPEPHYDLNDSIFYNGILVTLQIKRNAADMCFSGHTMITVLYMLMYFEYSKQCPILTLPTRMYTNVWINTLWTFFLTVYVSIGVIICFICTRFHYSLDCFVAFVFTYFLYQWYHFKIRETMFAKNPNYFIAFLQWFEQHAEDLQLERKKMRELQEIVEKYQYLQQLRIQSLVRNSPKSWNHFNHKMDTIV